MRSFDNTPATPHTFTQASLELRGAAAQFGPGLVYQTDACAQHLWEFASASSDPEARLGIVGATDLGTAQTSTSTDVVEAGGVNEAGGLASDSGSGSWMNAVTGSDTCHLTPAASALNKCAALPPLFGLLPLPASGTRLVFALQQMAQEATEPGQRSKHLKHDAGGDKIGNGGSSTRGLCSEEQQGLLGGDRRGTVGGHISSEGLEGGVPLGGGVSEGGGQTAVERAAQGLDKGLEGVQSLDDVNQGTKFAFWYKLEHV